MYQTVQENIVLWISISIDIDRYLSIYISIFIYLTIFPSNPLEDDIIIIICFYRYRNKGVDLYKLFRYYHAEVKFPHMLPL